CPRMRALTKQVWPRHAGPVVLVVLVVVVAGVVCGLVLEVPVEGPPQPNRPTQAMARDAFRRARVTAWRPTRLLALSLASRREGAGRRDRGVRGGAPRQAFAFCSSMAKWRAWSSVRTSCKPRPLVRMT